MTHRLTPPPALPAARRERMPKPRLLTAALLGLSLAVPLAGLLAAPAAHAQDAVSRSYDIAAAPLGTALSTFAAAAGITLSFNAEQTRGLQSAGLRGSYSVGAGLAQLLAGSGLEAIHRGGGNYVLQRVPQNRSESTLGEVKVSAQADSSATTEGTASYTTAGALTTSTKLSLSLRDTPQSLSILSRQRMDDQALNTLSDTLKQTAGVSVQNLGGERFSVYARGYTVDSYQFDGIPTTLDIVTQISAQSLADMAIYDRMEVLRGSTGLLTGAGDPSGTINLVRKRPTREFQAKVSASVGSWDLYRTEADIGGPLNEAGTLRGRLVGAYQRSGSYIDYLQQEKQVIYGVIEADLGEHTLLTAGIDHQRNDSDGTTTVGFPLFYSDGTQTDFKRSSTWAARWSNQQQEMTNAFLTLEHTLANRWQVKLAANQMRVERDYELGYASWGFPNKATGNGVKLYGGAGSTAQTQTGVDVLARGPFQLFGREHEMVLGYSSSLLQNEHNPLRGAGIEGRAINIYTWDNYTAEPAPVGKLYDGDTDVRQQGIYAAARFNATDDLSLIAGARSSRYRYKYSLKYALAASQRFNSVTQYKENDVITPYAGIVYRLDDIHSLYASYTSIFKPQSTRDRNGDLLKPREGNSYEAGLKSEFFGGRLNTSAAVYEIQQDNLAEVDPGQVVPGTTTSAYRAVEGARTRGIDLEASGELQPGWNLGASFSHSITRNADGDRIMTVMPKNMLKLFTTYQLPGAWQNLTVGGGMNWQSRIHFTATPTDLGRTVTAEQKAYATFDLMARYRITRQLSASLNINNLFDKKYLGALDTTFYSGYYGAPRNGSLKLDYSF